MPAEPEVSRLRAVLRLALLAVINVVMLAAYGLSPPSARRWRRRVQVWWCRSASRLIGLTVRRFGTPYEGRPALICANHASYLDIVVLAQVVEGLFVAKSDVARWPVFGMIARVTRTVFVDRTPARARDQSRQIDALIAAGERLILFPEGTSTDGTTVAPFKSSLFAIARPGPAAAERGRARLAVQPVSIAYTRTTDGTPLTGGRTEWYGWYGDMTLAPHLFRVAGMRGAEVELRFHPPIWADEVADRKDLARRCQRSVEAGVAAAHAALETG